MMRRYYLPGVTGVVLLLLLFGTATGVEDACRWESPNRVAAPVQETPALQSGDRDTYSGMIRVYVTEAEGRWEDSDGVPFKNNFLGFALREGFVLRETDTLTWSLEWDGNDFFDADGYSFGDLEESNVRVIAAVFDSASYTGYSDPEVQGSPFTVHEVDAAAAAKCGRTGYNLTANGFTHSVIVVDGSTTW
jgi:hypothetical protein